MAHQSECGELTCESCGKWYTDQTPVEELAEKYRSGPFYCWTCELEWKQRKWSLYEDNEKAAYLAGM
eukprot:3387922-Prorocentrum_lima.AAC.1